MIIRFKDLGKLKKKKTVYVTGCFDLAHRGHIRFLNQVKILFPKHKLVVGVQNDKRIKSGKGLIKPVGTQNERIEIVDSLKYVDFVFLCPTFKRSEVTLNILKQFNPDYFVTTDRSWINYEGKLEKSNTKLIVCKRYPHQSTTRIIEKIKRASKVEEVVKELKKGKKKSNYPILMMLFGFSGSGKTTVAKKITYQNKKIIHLSEETIEKSFSDQLKNEGWNPKTNGSIRRLLVEALLRDGYSLILDFCHLDNKVRDRYADIGRKTGSRVITVYINCEEAELKRRLNSRDKMGHNNLIKFNDQYHYQVKVFKMGKYDYLVNTSLDTKGAIKELLEEFD